MDAFFALGNKDSFMCFKAGGDLYLYSISGVSNMPESYDVTLPPL